MVVESCLRAQIVLSRDLQEYSKQTNALTELRKAAMRKSLTGISFNGGT
jgi:hypothetical protein